MISKKEIARLNGLVYLYAVSRENSKRKVSEMLGVSSDTLNKYIADLEAEMKTHFLVSNGRGTIVTPEGKRILTLADSIIEALHSMDNYACQAADFGGVVRLGMADAMADYLESDKIAEFYENYPKILIENNIVVGAKLPDMAAMEADIGLGYEPPCEDDLVLIRTKKIKCGLYASPGYLRQFGAPADMAALLKEHRICDKFNHLKYVDGWAALMARARHVVYKTNSIFVLRQMLERGIGIGICPVAYGEKKLVRVLKKEFEFEITIYLIAHKDTKDMPRIRAVLDYIIDVLDTKFK